MAGRFAVAASGEMIDDRALRAVIPGTGISQCQQAVTDSRELRNGFLNLLHFAQGRRFHIRRVAVRITEQR